MYIQAMHNVYKINIYVFFNLNSLMSQQNINGTKIYFIHAKHYLFSLIFPPVDFAMKCDLDMFCEIHPCSTTSCQCKINEVKHD